MVCQGLQEQTTATAMIVVRFGNVLGSAGSVIPKFQEQVAKGGPVTVTHPDVTRYFMSIPEASQLVLQAAAMGEGGQIYVLEMGNPIRIAELARDIIRLSGLSERQIRIEYTGLRAGEKLFEEVTDSREDLLETPHPKIRVVRAVAVSAQRTNLIVREISSSPALVDQEVRRRIGRWIEDYAPNGKGEQSVLASEAEVDEIRYSLASQRST
jgi:FlaA1/EpsC-like NDP-sugar epimerase